MVLILSVILDGFIDSESFFVTLIVIVIDNGEIFYKFLFIKEESNIFDVVYKLYRSNGGFEFIREVFDFIENDNYKGVDDFDESFLKLEGRKVDLEFEEND